MRPPGVRSLRRVNGSHTSSPSIAGTAHTAIASGAPTAPARGAVRLDTTTAPSVSENVVAPTASPIDRGSLSAITPGTMVPTIAIPSPPTTDPTYRVSDSGGTARTAQPTTTSRAPRAMMRSRLTRWVIWADRGDPSPITTTVMVVARPILKASNPVSAAISVVTGGTAASDSLWVLDTRVSATRRGRCIRPVCRPRRRATPFSGFRRHRPR